MIWNWWFIPLAIFLLGSYWSWREGRNPQTGMFPDMAPIIIFIGTLLVTGAIALGHFI